MLILCRKYRKSSRTLELKRVAVIWMQVKEKKTYINEREEHHPQGHEYRVHYYSNCG